MASTCTSRYIIHKSSIHLERIRARARARAIQAIAEARIKRLKAQKFIAATSRKKLIATAARIAIKRIYNDKYIAKSSNKRRAHDMRKTVCKTGNFIKEAESKQALKERKRNELNINQKFKPCGIEANQHTAEEMDVNVGIGLTSP
jgi:hypothetical protein